MPSCSDSVTGANLGLRGAAAFGLGLDFSLSGPGPALVLACASMDFLLINMILPECELPNDTLSAALVRTVTASAHWRWHANILYNMTCAIGPLSSDTLLPC